MKEVEREERRAEVALRALDPPQVIYEVTVDRGRGEEELELDSAGERLDARRAGGREVPTP